MFPCWDIFVSELTKSIIFAGLVHISRYLMKFENLKIGVESP